MSCKINRYALFWPDTVQYDSFQSWLQGIIFFLYSSVRKSITSFFFFPLLDTEIKKMEQIIKSPLISLTWKHPTLGSPPDKVILLGFFLYIYAHK